VLHPHAPSVKIVSFVMIAHLLCFCQEEFLVPDVFFLLFPRCQRHCARK